MLYALCGLSGSGKTTVLEATLQQTPHLGRLVTYTTRHPRPGEKPGQDYHFWSDAAFQTSLATAQLVCPIQYRGYWYATAQADLNTCRQRNMLAVLRPDKLACLAAYTPITSVYLEMVGHEVPATEEDQIIAQHKHACRFVLANIPGHLDQAVTALITILTEQKEERSHGGTYHTCTYHH